MQPKKIVIGAILFFEIKSYKNRSFSIVLWPVWILTCCNMFLTVRPQWGKHFYPQQVLS